MKGPELRTAILGRLSGGSIRKVSQRLTGGALVSSKMKSITVKPFSGSTSAAYDNWDLRTSKSGNTARYHKIQPVIMQLAHINTASGYPPASRGHLQGYVDHN